MTVRINVFLLLISLLALAGLGARTADDAELEKSVASVVAMREEEGTTRRNFIELLLPSIPEKHLFIAVERLVSENDERSARWALELCRAGPLWSPTRVQGPKLLGARLSDRLVSKLLDRFAEEKVDSFFHPLYTLLEILATRDRSTRVIRELFEFAERAEPPGHVRALAIRTLPESARAKEWKRAFKAYLAERDPLVRAEWIRFLPTEESPELMTALIEAYDARRFRTVEEARALVSSLARIGSEEAVKSLRDRAIYCRDVDERLLALRALAEVADHPMVEPLVREVERFEEKELAIRPLLHATVAEVLSSSKTDDGSRRLAELTQDTDPRVRLAAVSLYPTDREDSVEILAKSLSDPVSQVRSAGVWRLFATRRGDALHAILDRLEGLQGSSLPFEDAVRVLEMGTGQTFGSDVSAWLAWRSSDGVIPETFTPPIISVETSVPQFFQHRIFSHHPVFVLDLSGSMRSAYDSRTRVEALARELEAALGALNPYVEFSLVVFSDRARVWSEGPKPGTRRNAEQALDFLRSCRVGGATDYLAGLAPAFESDRYDTIYFLSDGLPNDSAAVEKWLAERNGASGESKIMIHTVGIGGRASFLEKMAEANAGFFRPMVVSRDAVD